MAVILYLHLTIKMTSACSFKLSTIYLLILSRSNFDHITPGSANLTERKKILSLVLNEVCPKHLCVLGKNIPLNKSAAKKKFFSSSLYDR